MKNLIFFPDEIALCADIKIRGIARWHSLEPAASNSKPSLAAGKRGFTLLELLLVLGIIAVLSSMAVLSINGLSTSGGVSRGVGDLTGILEQARDYAMANNTYVFVGLAEVDALQSPTVMPQATGIGRLVVAMVTSIDGTNNFSPGGAWEGNANLTQVAKLYTLQGIHMADFSSLTTTIGSMAERQPILAAGSLGNASVGTGGVVFTWPLLGAPKYNFYKVICFDSQGSSVIQTTASPIGVPQWLEIALQPAHGNVSTPAIVNVAMGDIASLQIDGTTGAVRIFRP